MGPHSKRRGSVVAALALWFVLPGSARPQKGDVFGPPPGTQASSPLDRGDTRDKNPAAARMQEQAARSRNDERQRKLVEDTAKLYALSSELKDQVAKTDKNTLSVDVVKKAEEIEKLARSVKEKMRGQAM